MLVITTTKRPRFILIMKDQTTVTPIYSVVANNHLKEKRVLTQQPVWTSS